MMETEESLYQNYYWTRLKHEWESNSIDLDESDYSLTPAKNIKRHSVQVSTQNLYESPYGIKAFKKKLTEVQSRNNNSKTLIISKKFFNDDLITDIYMKSLEQVCNYIDSTYKSIEKYNCYAEKLISAPSVIEHSLSLSDLSFDDTLKTLPSDRGYATVETKSSSNTSSNDVNNKSDTENAKNFLTNIVQNISPLSNHKDSSSQYESLVSDNVTKNNKSVTESNSIYGIESFNKSMPTIDMNNAMIDSVVVDTLNDTLDSIEDYCLFALGALHHFSSDSPSEIIDYCEGNRSVSKIYIYEVLSLTIHQSKHNVLECSLNYFVFMYSFILLQPPENDLQKNSADRVLSEHQLRVQRSLQKLNLPEWLVIFFYL